MIFTILTCGIDVNRCEISKYRGLVALLRDNVELNYEVCDVRGLISPHIATSQEAFDVAEN